MLKSNNPSGDPTHSAAGSNFYRSGPLIMVSEVLLPDAANGHNTETPYAL
ncbi:hypothetical protein [Chitinophaga caseinilytica]